MKRIHPPYDFDAIYALLVRSFAYMDGRIDPPSSLHRMNAATLEEEARDKELWVIEDDGRPVACMILTPKPDTLYLGKLAVDADQRGQGLARQMIEQAGIRAQQLGRPSVTLQVRVELIENQAAFGRMGFVQTGASSHEGFDRPTNLTFVRLVRPDAA
ncbi:GNAT family N-acetyltransferase [Thalassovita mangrovi]|uniref:GNAT family N-acetyltransferase n=1 Tax=Thalassovita mangrovi TaxID=2692236 RepID=A0A6L8LTQ7_9RHOB|nr:GNAT family N-acetyltransferase [Thalassovita mangrovi]MYM56792.1 GNAT family N-acetyltransferase [Thalassovita mangrovi]